MGMKVNAIYLLIGFMMSKYISIVSICERALYKVTIVLCITFMY